VCRFLLDHLGVARPLLTCFSNRLLVRLRNATATVEALMGVAFQWETRVRTQLASANTSIVPSRAWFEQCFLRSSPLYRHFQQGVTFLGFDEAWTIHPLVLDCLMAAAHESGVVTFSVGEALQITARTEPAWIQQGWHTTHGFAMPVWQHLQQQGSIIFLKLTENHRSSPSDAAMLRRVSGCQCFLVCTRVAPLTLVGACVAVVAGHAITRRSAAAGRPGQLLWRW
jgi:hypothetical protein